MIYFPDISAPSYPFSEKLENTSVRSEFEDGSVQTRIKFTRSRRTFKVKWELLPTHEYFALRAFIRDVVKYSAKSFMWIHPATYNKENGIGQEYIEVRIAEVGEATMKFCDYWAIELTLEEV